MREGTQGRQGLQDMAERIRERRRQLERSGRMDGLLEDLRDLLDTALEAERAALFPDPSDDARFREALLDNVPDDIGRAVRELSSYDWRSDEARAAFDQIRERLQRDVVDQQFRDLTHGIDSMSSPESRQALKEMMADLNQLLDKHQRGEDVSRRLPRVHRQAPRLLPGCPGDHRGVHRRPRPAVRGDAADAGLDEPRAASRAPVGDGAGAGGPRPAVRDGEPCSRTCGTCGPSSAAVAARPWTASAAWACRRPRTHWRSSPISRVSPMPSATASPAPTSTTSTRRPSSAPSDARPATTSRPCGRCSASSSGRATWSAAATDSS